MGADDIPALNACLNTVSALLLSAGYVAVKSRKLRLHAACMLSALAVSAIFLASYLYYHFAIRGGQPTTFTGQGWVRPAYFTLLISHTILAAVVAPLACWTAYLGLTRRLAKHKRVARVTLPLWIYVSITGVAVYWVLYRLYPAR